MNAPTNHANCPEHLKNRAAQIGLTVIVTDRQPEPLTRNTRSMRCPHGVQYWYQTIKEQT